MDRIAPLATTLRLPRRPALVLLAGALMRPGSGHAADPLPPVGDYPSQAIHVVSPFPAGGGNDLHMRLVSNELARVTGQPAVAENKGGAGGNVGTQLVAGSKPDGYTLLLSQVSIMAVNPTLYKAPGFDPLKSFVPVTQVNAAPLVLVVPAQSPLHDMADLRALAREQRVTYASPGNGTLSHLLGVVLEKDADLAMTHIPYRGAAPALLDLLGGRVTLMITSTASASGALRQGQLRVLAISSPRRVGLFTTVATLEEQGLEGLVFEDWYGFFAPAGTPPERVAYLNQAITSILRSSQVAQKIADAGGQVVAGTARQLAAQLQQDIDRWSRLVKLSGMRLE